MSALFPALKAMGSGCGEKLFYLTARNTTQAAAEDAIARLRAVQPDLALRSVTLTAKEKACLHPDAEGHPACLPEVCPLCKRLLRPHQECAGRTAGRQRPIQPCRTGRHRPTVHRVPL